MHDRRRPGACDARVARRGERVLEADLDGSPRPRTAPPTEVVRASLAVWPGARSTEQRVGLRQSLGAEPVGGGVQAGRVGRRDRAPADHRRCSARARGAGPSARCARPRAGTGRARPGSRTSSRRRPARATATVTPARSRSSVVPSSMRSPGSQRRAARRTRRPLTRTPLVEPRSATVHPPSAGRGHLRRAGATRWRRRGRCRSRGCGRASRRPRPSTIRRLPSSEEHRCAGLRRTGALLQRLAHPVGGRVDHRVAGGRPCAARSACSCSGGWTSRAWMPNSPSVSRSSVRNSITGREISAKRSRRACSSR